MADVLPFAGTRFNTKENESIQIADVICPPFDDITDEQRQAYLERSPYNLVRVVAGAEAAGDDEQNNKYLRASESYREWKTNNVLVDEQRKCFYVYEHTFKLPNTKKTITRRGFFGLVKLQDFRSGKIRAHEMTFPEPKNERLRLLKATELNVEPLFILYEDQEKEVEQILAQAASKGKPTEVVENETGTHKLWMVHRKDPILSINKAMKPKRLYIADGHHRYEAALQYRDEMREITGRRDGRQPYDFILMYLNQTDDESLFIDSCHRVLARDLGLDVDLDEVIEDLEEFFTLKEFKVNLKEPQKAADQIRKSLKSKGETRFVMALPGGRAFEMALKKDADLEEMIDQEFMSDLVKRQDVTILHRYVIAQGWVGNPEIEIDEEDITYCRKSEEALEMLANRKGCAAFFMNPMTLDKVLEVAENGELLPHNSTYFHPKILSGFVMRDLKVGFVS